MKLSEVKNRLGTMENISFALPDGTFVPNHFHVTEIGKINKHFIDCGGTLRHEEVVSFQLWNANDYGHRLQPEKLATIIALSERALGIEDLEVEVEYQSGTIGKFGLDYNGNSFILTNKQTNCLASDKCGNTSAIVQTTQLAQATSACCAPGGNCCA